MYRNISGGSLNLELLLKIKEEKLINYLQFCEDDIKNSIYNDEGKLIDKYFIFMPKFRGYVDKVFRIRTLFDFLSSDQRITKWIDREIIPDLDNSTGMFLKKNFEDLTKSFHKFLKPYIMSLRESLEKFAFLEMHRIEESIVCYENECYTASVIMAVSAVEFRLNNIVKKTDPKIYDESFKKKNAGFGEIIKLFDEKQYTDNKYEKIKNRIAKIPASYRTISLLLNDNRRASAHPRAIMDKSMCKPILLLCIEFLLSQQT